MIKPVNGHILIEPEKHESFMARQQDTYEEIGTVLAIAPELCLYEGGTGAGEIDTVAIGDKVYFDAWLAAKFPGEKDDEHYWLVKWEDVRAVEHAKSE